MMPDDFTHKGARHVDRLGEGGRVMASEGVRITEGPSETREPGRWRLFFDREPEGPWRQAFLERAALTPARRALAVTFEGSTLVFTCAEGREQLLFQAMRTINDLVDETNQESRR
jgi:hypothetical protein